MNHLKCLVVEDLIDEREYLIAIINQLNFKIDQPLLQAESVDKAINAIATHQPDLIFLDHQLGNEYSYEIMDYLQDYVQQPLQRPYAPKVIMVTADRTRELFKQMFMKYGALVCDFIDKPYQPEAIKKSLQEQLPKCKKNIVLTLNTIYGNVIVNTDSIFYATVKDNRNIEITYIDAQNRICKATKPGNLSTFADEMYYTLLVRIGSKHVINPERVEKTNAIDTLFFTDNESIEVSEKAYKLFVQLIQN
jgi:DNA-binding LytR/AlgR family response regulator